MPARIGDFAPMLHKEFRSGDVVSSIVIDKIFEMYNMLFFGSIGLFALRNLPMSVVVSIAVGFKREHRCMRLLT